MLTSEHEKHGCFLVSLIMKYVRLFHYSKAKIFMNVTHMKSKGSKVDSMPAFNIVSKIQVLKIASIIGCGSN